MTKEQEIGELLQKTRMQKLLDISTIAEGLKIRKKYLISLEEGNFKEIPGSPYIEGYIKLYADYFGISKEIASLKTADKKDAKTTIIKVKKHINDNWILASIYAVVILLALFFILVKKDSDKNKNNIIEYLIEDNIS